MTYKVLLILVLAVVFLTAGFFAFNDYIYNEKQAQVPVRVVEEGVVYECDGDAFICPDGTTVGRSGPDCEFIACPSGDAISTEVTTYLGGSASARSVSISPKEIISDSRCPATVKCIWAGTIKVRTTFSTAVAHGEHVMTLGTPQMFGDDVITLTDVTPTKTEESIPDSSYRFTYTIEKSV